MFPLHKKKSCNTIPVFGNKDGKPGMDTLHETVQTDTPNPETI